MEATLERRVNMAAVAITVFLPLCLLVAAGQMDVVPKFLTRDPYSAAEVPWYTGYFSQVGAAVMLSACCIGVAVGATVKAITAKAQQPVRLSLLLAVSALGLFMAVDDLLLFHDGWARALGLPEPMFHLAYLVSVVAIGVKFASAMRKTPWHLFAAAICFFGLSSAIDSVRIFPEWVHKLEDAPKIIGIFLWAIFVLFVAWLVVRDERDETRPSILPS